MRILNRIRVDRAIESVTFNLKPQFKLLLDTLRTKFFADSIIEIISFIEINL